MANASLEGLSPEQIEQLAGFAHAVLSNKSTKLDAQKLAKKINPNFNTPELTIDEKITEAREADKKQIDDLSDRLQKNEITEARARKASDLKAQGFDIEAVEKVMTDNQIGSYETAVKFMRGEQALAPATPALVGSGNANLPSEFKDIMKNPSKWAREKAAEILNDARQGKPV